MRYTHIRLQSALRLENSLSIICMYYLNMLNLVRRPKTQLNFKFTDESFIALSVELENLN